MAQPAVKKYFSPAEYLELEEAAEYKSEYYDGEIFAMAGTTSDHNLVNGNVYARMNLAFGAKDCVAYINDVKLWVEARGFFAYPDIAVVCGKTKHYENRKDAITNPILIVEVLSDSTKDYDRGTKFKFYRSLPTLREYIMIDQYEIHVEQYSRDADGQWVLQEYHDANAVLRCTSVDFQISLREVYAKVEFAQK